MYIKVSTTIENSKWRFFDVNANNGRSATIQCLYSAKTTITIIYTILHCEGMHTMDLSPFRQNFEKNRNRQKYHHSLKEHPTFTKIAKFGCEML